jgi:hypothetical protein
VTPYVQAWLGAFLFTQAVEVPIWAYALHQHRKVSPSGERWTPWVCIALGFGASAITHPFVWFFFPFYAPGDYVEKVIQAELFAVVVEAIYMNMLGLRWPLGWSFVANAASAGLGLISRSMFGWP